MSYASGGGAHAQSELMVSTIVDDIAAARRATTLRWRLTFLAV